MNNKRKGWEEYLSRQERKRYPDRQGITVSDDKHGKPKADKQVYCVQYSEYSTVQCTVYSTVQAERQNKGSIRLSVTISSSSPRD